MLEERHSLPNMDRLSVLSASILLAYAMLPFVRIPERNIIISLLGAVFVFQVQFSTILAVVSAALAAAGTDWLLRDHPRLGRQATFQHWLLPALTAWVIGMPLNSLAVGVQWWAVFALGGLLLVLVLTSEYVAVDPYDSRHGPVAVGLTAISFALFLILAITLVAAGLRLYLLLPALAAAVFLITLRNLNLRLVGRWPYAWAIAVTLVVGQVAAALHYWPITPLRYGLILLGPAYALTSLAAAYEEGRSLRRAWIEPALMLAALWGLALFLRV